MNESTSRSISSSSLLTISWNHSVKSIFIMCGSHPAFFFETRQTIQKRSRGTLHLTMSSQFSATIHTNSYQNTKHSHSHIFLIVERPNARHFRQNLGHRQGPVFSASNALKSWVHNRNCYKVLLAVVMTKRLLILYKIFLFFKTIHPPLFSAIIARNAKIWRFKSIALTESTWQNKLPSLILRYLNRTFWQNVLPSPPRQPGKR